jgi:hypothetical protein
VPTFKGLKRLETMLEVVRELIGIVETMDKDITRKERKGIMGRREY